jgi:hypothetical protein
MCSQPSSRNTSLAQSVQKLLGLHSEKEREGSLHNIMGCYQKMLCHNVPYCSGAYGKQCKHDPWCSGADCNCTLSCEVMFLMLPSASWVCASFFVLLCFFWCLTAEKSSSSTCYTKINGRFWWYWGGEWWLWDKILAAMVSFSR